MDATILLDALAPANEIAEGLREALSSLNSNVFGRPVPLVFYPAILFLPVGIWALFLGRPALITAVAVLAWLGAVAFWGAQPAALGLVQLAAAWSVAVLLGCASAIDLTRRRRLHLSLQTREAELARTSDDLDRERLWRRASGDERADVDDAHLRDLLARMNNLAQAQSKAS